MHICRGHTGTVTCLALPHVKQSNENIKSINNYLFSGINLIIIIIIILK